ncbi:MAG: hypothetical protein JF609_01835 [Verrucomicrobia bacterium]|nr:hypothetical protein [Verrucomicrobiota bacterium]
MKFAQKIIFPLAVALATGLAGCSKPAAETPPAAPEKAGVTVDAETQERIGLKIESPVAMQWQPAVRATGHVADPMTFAAAVADYEAARAAAAASQSELDRTQKLAAEDNASARVLEAAQVVSARDALVFKTAQAKFAADWGAHLASQTNLSAYAEQFLTDGKSLVKLSLPAGAFLNPPPPAATILALDNETNTVTAELADDMEIDLATQVQTLLYAADKKLPSNIAVTGLLKIAGDPVDGVVVPVGAVLRHEGRGWAYVQTETNQFVRVEIPLDRLTDSGWFVSENLSATNHIVTVGAQTVLSAELSGGGFNTGQRD